MCGAIFRTPKFWKQEREMHAKAIDLLKIVGLQDMDENRGWRLPAIRQTAQAGNRPCAWPPNMKLLMLDEPAAGMNPTGDRGSAQVHQ